MRRSFASNFMIILGILGIIFGIVYGPNSHHITYQGVGRGAIAHYLSNNELGYLQMVDSPILYILHETDFTPIIQGTKTLIDGDEISFKYQTTDTTDIDVTSDKGTHLSGTAYNIVQVTFYDTNTIQNYATLTYMQHPRGFDYNNWGVGIAAILAGLVLIIGSFFLKKQPTSSFNLSSPESMEPSPPANSYQQRL